MRRAIDRALLGSPPSSARISLTGWPARPPRALTSAAHARAPWGTGSRIRPIGPVWVPNEPREIVLFAPPAGVAGDPGALGVPMPGLVLPLPGGAADADGPMPPADFGLAALLLDGTPGWAPDAAVDERTGEVEAPDPRRVAAAESLVAV